MIVLSSHPKRYREFMSDTVFEKNDIYISSAEPKDYFSLLKPRVMSLVIFTALVGFAVRPDNMHPFLMVISLLSIAIGAGASGALNMWYDADIDNIMKRTQSRPIPSGRILADNARDFGLILSVFSVMTLYLASNLLAAFLLAFTIFFYVVVYSMWLKRSTPQNIVIGGLAGALPPLVATAASAGTITLEGLILCAIIFFWTPPHFWALALVKKQDYQNVGVPMMPNVKGDQRTITEILIYFIALYALAFLPVYFGFGDILYLIAAGGIGAVYGYSCLKIKQDFDKPHYHKTAMKKVLVFLFSISLLYLQHCLSNRHVE